MKNLLEDAICNLLRTNRFYAKVLLRLKRSYTTDIPTMGVNVQNGTSLLINPHFFKDRTMEEKVDLLKHEIFHLAFRHKAREEVVEPGLREELKGKVSLKDVIHRMTEASEWNKAEDIAINQMLPNIPKQFHLYDDKGNVIKDEKTGLPQEYSPITLDSIKKVVPNVKGNMPMEYYYGILKQNKDKFQNDGGKVKLILLDDHEGNNKSDGEVSLGDELSQEMIKKLFKEAVEECGGPQSNDIPSEFRELVKSMLTKTKDWRSDLNHFVAMCAQIEIESTRRRKNRRYAWQYPGNRTNPKLRLVLGIDTSGSIFGEAFTQFMSEIQAISELGVDIITVQCDTKIQSIESYRQDTKLEMKGRGGTCFAPLFDLVGSNDFISEYGEVDGLIFLTDGENFDEVQEPNYPVLWALLDGHKTKYDWGAKTNVTINKAS
jgi:predicted metal-dependent peptidase